LEYIRFEFIPTAGILVTIERKLHARAIPLGKILLLALAIWLLLTILKNYRRNLDAPPPAARGGNMVRCERCAIYVPESESILKDGKRYCCEAHADSPGQ
jgi:uncharacterized protein